MEEKKSVWTDHYNVSWYDTDITKSASLAAVCNYLQETAWHHADHLNFGLRMSFSSFSSARIRENSNLRNPIPDSGILIRIPERCSKFLGSRRSCIVGCSLMF